VPVERITHKTRKTVKRIRVAPDKQEATSIVARKKATMATPKSGTVMVRVRVDQQRKEEADAILRRLGLTATQVVNVLYAQIVARKKIPFPIALPDDSDIAISIEHVAKVWNKLDDTDYSYLIQ